MPLKRKKQNLQVMSIDLFISLAKEITIILAVYLMGELLAYFSGAQHFGGIIGLFILLALLHLHIIKVSDIHKVTTFFLEHMAFFFIPAGVSIMANYYLLDGVYLQVFILLTLSTLFVMSSTALCVDFLLKRRNVS